MRSSLDSGNGRDETDHWFSPGDVLHVGSSQAFLLPQEVRTSVEIWDARSSVQAIELNAVAENMRHNLFWLKTELGYENELHGKKRK